MPVPEEHVARNHSLHDADVTMHQYHPAHASKIWQVRLSHKPLWGRLQFMGMTKIIIPAQMFCQSCAEPSTRFECCTHALQRLLHHEKDATTFMNLGGSNNEWN